MEKMHRNDGLPLTGKVSVVHFLNDRLKPKEKQFVKETYPVYMRAIFNKKSTNIKSNFDLFTIEQIDVFDYLKYKLTSPTSSYLSKEQFNSPRYKEMMAEESRVVCEVIRFYGQYGVNILLDNPSAFITISLPFIQKIFSDFLWRKLHAIQIEHPEIRYILNEQSSFDRQIESLLKYGNAKLKSIISKLQAEAGMMKMLKTEKNFRVYEWWLKRGEMMLKFEKNHDFIINLRMAISQHYQSLADVENKKLFKKISDDA